MAFLDAFQHRAPQAKEREADLRAGFAPLKPAIGRDIHVCIVCEPLGENLLSLLERHKKRGVAPDLVKVIGRQLLLGLVYLHDECGLVHTDIKPENIMISIPDVEAHIRSELNISPRPTSRRVGVPLLPKARVGPSAVQHHRRPNQSAHAATRLAFQRQVEIFDSQPLSSPTTSAASSPATRAGFAMTRMKSGKIHGGNKGDATVSLSSSVSTTPVFSMGATPPSTIVSAASSPPTSLGSAFSQLTMSASDASMQDVKGKAKAPSVTPVPEEQPEPAQLGHAKKPSAGGPSLLTQTAPSDHKRPTPLPLEESPSSSSSSHSTSSQSLSSPSTSLSRPVELSLPLDLLPDVTSELPTEVPTPTSPVPLPGPAVSHFRPLPPIQIKIADLGNATPATRHYTEDIQTRQYRAPEALIGRSDWGYTADVWSAACVLFELLTAEYLFDPQGQGELFTKDDDHIAQMIELVGDIPPDIKFGGRFSRELFDSQGKLRYIKSLKPWPLDRVMVEKYLFSEEEAAAFAAFMLPMLKADLRERASAASMVDHPWLDV